MNVRRPALFVPTVAAILAFTLAVSGCGGLLSDSSAPRAPGPFDPGQSGLPVAEEVEAICGSSTVGRLRGTTDGFFAVALSWERYQAFVDAVKVDGVTVEELSGVEQRHDNIVEAIQGYRDAAEDVRYRGANVSGVSAADCDRKVFAVFETVYQEREDEIVYVQSESERILQRMRSRAD